MLTVTDLDHKTDEGQFIVTRIRCLKDDRSEVIDINDRDFVFVQNVSMTEASSLGR
jgi:oleate hydratase